MNRQRQSRLASFGSHCSPKRAQIIGQVFIFILAGVVFVLILMYGYKAITSFLEKGEQVQLLDFRNSLDSTISLIKRDYGSVQRVDLRVPPKTEEVCFVTDYESAGSVSTPRWEQDFRDKRALLASAWSTKSENIFLIPRQPTPILINDVLVDPGGYCCIAAANGHVTLRVEGLGNKAKVSPWAPATCQ